MTNRNTLNYMNKNSKNQKKNKKNILDDDDLEIVDDDDLDCRSVLLGAPRGNTPDLPTNSQKNVMRSAHLLPKWGLHGVLE